MAAHVPRVSVRQAYQARLVFLIAHALQDTGGRGESARRVVEENSVHFLAKPLDSVSLAEWRQDLLHLNYLLYKSVQHIFYLFHFFIF